MTSTIKEIAKKFKNSEPVFVPDNYNSQECVEEPGVCRSDSIRFRVENEYDPMSDIDTNNPIERLVADQWSEQFDRVSREFYGSVSESGVDSKLHGLICRALVSASPLKNPEQSKLYKFISNFRDDRLELRELYISLYIYIAPHTDDKNRFYNGSSCKHAQNFIAILEKVRAKYER